ncbi:KMT5A methyltransferase, partial [Polypterus senegalus]
MYRCTKPSLETFQRKIERQGWESNCPKAGEIVSLWKPASKNEVEEDRKISRTVQHLRWRGLHIKDFGSEKGFGVFATRRFSKGDIVCDYHGQVVTKGGGLRLVHSKTDEMGCVFFYKSGDTIMAIDAQTHPCQCHPDVDIIGRRINHSRKRFNLKPKLNQARLNFQTVMNYMKSVKLFTSFLLCQTNVTLQDPEKHNQIKMYIDNFSVMQKNFSKQVSKEIAAKRWTKVDHRNLEDDVEAGALAEA